MVSKNKVPNFDIRYRQEYFWLRFSNFKYSKNLFQNPLTFNYTTPEVMRIVHLTGNELSNLHIKWIKYSLAIYSAHLWESFNWTISFIIYSTLATTEAIIWLRLEYRIQNKDKTHLDLRVAGSFITIASEISPKRLK